MTRCLLIAESAKERGDLLPILKRLGLHCETREGMEEGIEFCDAQMPDVIIMEASVRPATREFLKMVRLRGQGQAAPIVILYASNPDMQAMGASILEGAAEFLVKPFNDSLMRFKLELAGVALH